MLEAWRRCLVRIGEGLPFLWLLRRLLLSQLAIASATRLCRFVLFGREVRDLILTHGHASHLILSVLSICGLLTNVCILEVVLDIRETVRHGLIGGHCVRIGRVELVVGHVNETVAGRGTLEPASSSASEVTNAILVVFETFGPTLRRLDELLLAVRGCEAGPITGSNWPLLALLNRVQLFHIEVSLVLHQILDGHRVQFGRSQSVRSTAA